MILFIYYPNCSTCKKAKKWLDENHIPYTGRDIKLDNPNFEELKTWQEQSGLPIKKFFKTSGIIYKEENLKNKLPTMTQDEQLILLSTNGMLVKRPLIITSTAILIGFKQEAWAEALLN